MAGNTGTLGANRVLDHLNDEILTLSNQFFDRFRGAAPLGHRLRLVVALLEGGVLVVHIVHMEEGGLLHADVHKGSLHAGQNPQDPRLVDIADNAPFTAPLQVELGDGAVLQNGNARLLRGGIHQ